MSSSTRLVTVGFLLSLAASATAIRCWKCGQYSDGVGSITPCINRSAAYLEECASNAKYCILISETAGPILTGLSLKYVSELTIVRDCVPTCKEKEWWGARTFCCDTDECNSAVIRSPLGLLILILIAFLAR